MGLEFSLFEDYVFKTCPKFIKIKKQVPKILIVVNQNTLSPPPSSNLYEKKSVIPVDCYYSCLTNF